MNDIRDYYERIDDPVDIITGGFATTNKNGVFVITRYSDSSVSYVPAYRSGYKNPDWERVIRLGGNATSPYTATFKEYRVQRGSSKQVVKNGTSYVQNGRTYPLDLITTRSQLDPLYFPASSAVITPGTVTMVRDTGQSAHLNALSNALAPLKGGVFLGEIRETISLLRHPLKIFELDTTKYLKKATSVLQKKISNRKKRQAISSYYLEYTYGISPFLADIQGAGETLRRITSQVKTSTVRTTRSATESGVNHAVTGVVLGTAMEPGSFIVTKSRVTYDSRFVSKIKVSFDKTDPLGNLGLGLSDFVPTLYELLPGSFLVDYFSNLGDIVQSASFPYSRIIFTNIGSRISIVNSIELAGSPVNNASTSGEVSFQTGTYKETRVTRDRLLLGDYHTPTIQFNVPSLGHIFNALNIVLANAKFTPIKRLL